MIDVQVKKTVWDAFGIYAQILVIIRHMWYMLEFREEQKPGRRERYWGSLLKVFSN